MKKLFSAAAFAAGLSVVGWVGTGYLASHPLALATTLLIAGFYVLGAFELLRFMHATDALREALQALQDTPKRLADWLAPLPDTLRSAVQQRIEGTRAALPGPVLGLLLLVAGCALRPSLAQMLRPVTSTILGNLSLFFVPAGVGVVAHLQQFRQEGLAIAVALTVSTALAIAAGALVFKIVARWTGQDSEPGE